MGSWVASEWESCGFATSRAGGVQHIDLTDGHEGFGRLQHMYEDLSWVPMYAVYKNTCTLYTCLYLSSARMHRNLTVWRNPCSASSGELGKVFWLASVLSNVEMTSHCDAESGREFCAANWLPRPPKGSKN